MQRIWKVRGDGYEVLTNETSGNTQHKALLSNCVPLRAVESVEGVAPSERHSRPLQTEENIL